MDKKLELTREEKNLKNQYQREWRAEQKAKGLNKSQEYAKNYWAKMVEEQKEQEVIDNG